MRRSREEVIAAGRHIRELVTATEDHADCSLRAQALLLDALLTARLDLKFAASFKRDIIAAAGRELAAKLRSRERMLDQHEMLAKLAGQLGVEVRMFGDGGDKDAPSFAPKRNTGTLSLAASA